MNRGKKFFLSGGLRRTAKEKPMDEVLNEFIRYCRIRVPVKEGEIIKAWEEIMGEFISKMTTDIYVENQCLYIEVSSPSLKNELMEIRTAILEKIKEKVEDSGLRSIYIK